jgi:hypothetical protein
MGYKMKKRMRSPPFYCNTCWLGKLETRILKESGFLAPSIIQSLRSIAFCNATNSENNP